MEQRVWGAVCRVTLDASAHPDRAGVKLHQGTDLMHDFPDDIFTEPEDVDPDTLANLGPLRRLAGASALTGVAGVNRLEVSSASSGSGNTTNLGSVSNAAR